jgi:hypothetical protein
MDIRNSIRHRWHAVAYMIARPGPTFWALTLFFETVWSRGRESRSHNGLSVFDLAKSA